MDVSLLFRNHHNRTYYYSGIWSKTQIPHRTVTFTFGTMGKLAGHKKGIFLEGNVYKRGVFLPKSDPFPSTVREVIYRSLARMGEMQRDKDGAALEYANLLCDTWLIDD